MVKVNSTEAGIAKGPNPGCRTVGVARTVPMPGLTPAETDAPGGAGFHRMRNIAHARLTRALARGERP